MRDAPTRASAPDRLEREIKFALDSVTAADLRRDPLLSQFEPSTFPQISEYWDTDDQALRRAGVSLRLRHIGGRIVQTLKSAAPSDAGPLARRECETPILSGRPDMAELRTFASKRLVAEVEGRLAPQFTVNVDRTRWTVTCGGAELCVDLDIGHIDAPHRHQRLLELEIELVSGSTRAVFDLARQLSARHRLDLEFASKSDRGYQLLGGTSSLPEAKGAGTLDVSLSRADAFRALSIGGLRAFASLAGAFSPAAQPEQVHKLRVVLRRFRTLLRFDRDLLTPQERSAIALEADEIFDKLGAARNLDVLLAEVASETGASLSAEAVEALTSERGAAYRDLDAMLHSPHCRLVLVDLLAFLDHGPWLRRPADAATRRQSPAQEGAEAALHREWNAVRRAERPSSLSVERRHRLRIHAKRLRYACDFYGSLYPGGKARARSGALTVSAAALQDVLGTLNDRAMILALLAQRFPDHRWPSPDESELLRTADAAHRKLRHCRPFWE